MDNIVFKYFINYLVSKSLYSDENLFVLRILSKTTKIIIESNDRIKKIIDYQNNIKKILSYDKDVYDRYYYVRITTQNLFKNLYEKYKLIRIPYITYCFMDSDSENEDNEKINYVDDGPHLLEFNIFLYEYINNPMIQLEIFPVKLIKNLQIENKSIMQKHILSENQNNLVLLTPLLYKKNEPESFIKLPTKIIVHVNVINFDNNNINNNKYMIITTNLDLQSSDFHTDLKKYLTSITTSINSNSNINKIKEYHYLEDILKECFSFEKCFNILLK